MKILGLDSATRIASVAIADGDACIADARSEGKNTDLLVAVDDVCARAKLTAFELDAVAIGAGPGSFTGLRIGMATAKGIAFAAQKPLWAVSSLAALAWDGHKPDTVTVAVLDARRSEVFAGCYAELDGVWQLIGTEHVMSPEALAAWVTQTIGDREHVFTGDAIDAYRDQIASIGRWLDVKTPSGFAVAYLASRGPRVDILTSGTPTYIRPSEAEVLYPDGVPGAFRRK